MPAVWRTFLSTPLPAQQPASFPLIATAGTLRTPKRLALAAPLFLCISRTVTSQDSQASFFTSSIVCLHAEHPALNISILRFFIFIFILESPFQSQDLRVSDTHLPTPGCSKQRSGATKLFS